MYIGSYESSTECKLANVANVCIYILLHIIRTYIYLITHNMQIHILYICTHTHTNHLRCASSPTLQLYVCIYISVYCIYVHTHIRIFYGVQARQRCNCMYNIYISIYDIYCIYVHTHIRIIYGARAR